LLFLQASSQLRNLKRYIQSQKSTNLTPISFSRQNSGGKRLKRIKTNEDAWNNYYRANRYCMLTYDSSDGSQSAEWVKENPILKDPDEIFKLIEKKHPEYIYLLQV